HVLENLSKEVEWAQLVTWFKNTADLGLEKGTLTVGLPYPLVLNWHLKAYADRTLKAAQTLEPGVQRIEYQVDTTLQDADPRVIDLIPHFPKKTDGRKLPEKNQLNAKKGIVSTMINRKYTRENFITSPENRLAHA